MMATYPKQHKPEDRGGKTFKYYLEKKKTYLNLKFYTQQKTVPFVNEGKIIMTFQTFKN